MERETAFSSDGMCPPNMTRKCLLKKEKERERGTREKESLSE